MMPLGAAVMLRNATLEDHSWRTGGGALPFGAAIGAVTILAGIDYWPDVNTQRTVVLCDDGTLRKDNGAGAGWTTIASGLTTTGIQPFFQIGGQEAAGRLRRLFYFDGVNPVQMLTGDAAAMTALTAPAVDWAGTNQPLFGVPHQGFFWGAGNTNAPHTLYRSKLQAYDDYTTTPYVLPIAPGEGERLVGGLSYKGGLLVFKYPAGAYFVDTAAASDTNWRVLKVAGPGAAGGGVIVAVEDDVFWVSPDGSWHMISATFAYGSVRASDLSYRKLGSFFREQVNVLRLNLANLLYYAQKQALYLGCAGQGQIAKNRRIDLDLNRRQDLGERWVFWDRDRNEALFLRKINNVQVPVFGDAAGQLWLLDQTQRVQGAASNQGYAFEWFLQDTDFGHVVPGFQGRKKNLRFLQLEYDPRSAANHTVEVYLDGKLRQTISFALTGGASALPVVLPVVLGTSTLQLTRRRRALGQFTRLALRGYSTGASEDVSITKILVGCELAEEGVQVAA